MLTDLMEFIETASRMSVEALLNGLWQGVALTVVIWALVKVAPRLHSRGRFAIWAATLAVVVGLPFVTGQKLLPPVIAKYFISGDESPAFAGEHLEATRSGPNQTALFVDYSEDYPQKASGASVANLSSNRNLPEHSSATTEPTNARLIQRTNKLSSAILPVTSISTNNQKPVATNRENKELASKSASRAVFSFVLSRSGAFLFLGIWLVISIALVIRLAYSYWSLQSLLASATEAPGGLQTRFEHWMNRQKITRDVRLLLSSEITVPLAVGFGSPAVVIPQSIIASLSDDEFDLVLVHELAHLKRRDDWSVFWQQMAQALFFVNPAIIWIARRMDFERELACDNEVVSYIGSPKKYAACLARLAELSSKPRHSALVAGTFISKNRLVARIERLLSNTSFGSSQSTKITVSATFALLLLALAQFTLIPAVVAVEEPQREQVSSGVRVAPIDRVEYSSADNDMDSKRRARQYKQQRRSAKKEIRALKSAMRDFKAQNKDVTPEIRSQLRSYSESLRQYERQLDKINRSLERQSRQNRKYSVSSGSGLGFVAPPRFPASPSTPVVVPSAPRADRDRYAYSYSFEAPDVSAPVVSVAPVNLVDPVIVVDVPGFTIEDGGDWSISSGDGEHSYNWSDGGHKIRVRARGDFEFTDDETDIKSISDEGYFTVRERGRGVDREYEVLADEDGELDKTYYEDGRRSDIDDNGKGWIQETILFVLRNSAIGAKDRAERILAKDGADGVLDEIEQMDSDYVKRAYYNALFGSGKLNFSQIQKALRHIGHEIDSDYEKAQILASIDENSFADDATLEAYIGAVNTIDSDYDKRRSLETVLSRENLPKGVAISLVRVAESIDSDYERSELLRSLAETGLDDEDVVTAYAEAIAGIDSDYEKRRALEGITDRRDLSKETVLAILKMAQDIDSDYERAELLSEISRYDTGDDNDFADAYYAALVDMDSNYEKRRTLSKLLNKRDLGKAMALSILKLADTFDSDYERAQLLSDIDMAKFRGENDFYESYLIALKGIDSDFEKNRALSNLEFDKTTSDDILMIVLEAIDGFDSDFEKAKALKRMAPYFSKDDKLTDAFMDVTDGIDSDYDRDKVIATLYKAGRSSRRSRSRSESSMD